MLYHHSKKADISLILVVVIGIGLSLTAFSYVKGLEQQRLLESKQRQTDIYVRSLRQTFSTFTNLLHSIRSLHNVYNNISYGDFNEFIKRDLFDFPSIQAVEWIGYVPNAQKTLMISEIRKQGLQTFDILDCSDPHHKQPLQQDTYYPTIYVEPSIRNVKNMGCDISVQPALKYALEKSAQQMQLIISSVLPISTDAGMQLGFQIFLPVYNRDVDVENTPAQRRAALKGFASLIVTVDNLVHDVLRSPRYKTNTFLHITDTTLPEQPQDVYLPPWTREKSQNIIELVHATIEFGERQWRISLDELQGENSFALSYSWGFLIIGLLFTFGVFRYLKIVINRARWAEELVANRTQNLQELNDALDESRRRFQAIFNEAAMGIAQLDLQGHITDSNKALQELLDYNHKELQGRLLRSLCHEDDADIDIIMMHDIVAGEYDNYMVSKRYRCKNGAQVWTNQNCSVVHDSKEPFIVSMIEDITERKCAEMARLEAEQKYREIFENAMEGIYQCTPTGFFLSVNPAFVRIFGYDSAQQMLAEVTNLQYQLYLNSKQRLQFMHLLETQLKVKNFEYQAQCRDGLIIWINETARVVRDEQGNTRYYEGIIEDVSERKKIEGKLRYDASHDQLTGLLNRAKFTECLNSALCRLIIDHETEVIPLAVLFADLDRFKIVNDSMGHLVGDKLLIEVAKRLLAQSDDERDVVARFGGDEFALMFQNVPNVLALEKRIERIQQQLGYPYVLDNENFNTTVSIGIALATTQYKDSSEILRDADTAMYEAKKQGRGKAVVFQPGMHADVLNLLRMESDLRKAFENSEFMLYYQPIISLKNRQTVSLEALIRWKHPEKGFISPDIFIPIAEETGLIKELGLWVFETACKQVKEWQSKFSHHAHLGININVSPIQLRQARLVQQIQDILEKTGVQGNSCRIEITETAMMQDPDGMYRVLNQLKELNVLLYIDDFGMGYTSLSYLKKFPIDALKIDKAFIQEMNAPGGRPVQIAGAIVALGEAFNLNVVAEGVESGFQVAVLESVHCNHVQGYFFSRPKDSLSIESFLTVPIH
jgi:diguanylate cyclase (GGDEF)-like protein/PAS domain S-box-containing protein